MSALSFLLQNLAYEIILTLGQAFEVAYQLALQARKGGHSSTLPESFENKPSKPIPKPRVSIRKSVVSRKHSCCESLDGRERGLPPPRPLWGGGAALLHLFLGSFPACVCVILPTQFLQSIDHVPEPGGSHGNSMSCFPWRPSEGPGHCCCPW